MTYNGWTNRETWCCHLWLTNDEGTYNWLSILATNFKPYELANFIEDYLTEWMPDTIEEHASIYDDLLSTAIHNINFDEVANTFYDE